MIVILFLVFFGFWLLDVTFQVAAGGLIHLLLIVAIIALIVHSIRRAA